MDSLEKPNEGLQFSESTEQPPRLQPIMSSILFTSLPGDGPLCDIQHVYQSHGPVENFTNKWRDGVCWFVKNNKKRLFFAKKMVLRILYIYIFIRNTILFAKKKRFVLCLIKHFQARYAKAEEQIEQLSECFISLYTTSIT